MPLQRQNLAELKKNFQLQLELQIETSLDRGDEARNVVRMGFGVGLPAQLAKRGTGDGADGDGSHAGKWEGDSGGTGNLGEVSSAGGTGECGGIDARSECGA